MAKQRIDYLNLLVEELIKFYNLTKEEAHNAVYTSATEKMMYNDADAEWQMHQSISSTIDEIFCEYKGLPITV